MRRGSRSALFATVPRLSRLSLCILFASLYETAGHAADPPCPGITRQEHPKGAFRFETNSRVETVGKRKNYYSCVRNLDLKNDLYVNWYIPGPYRAWLPGGRSDERPRLSDDLKETPLNGCLEYGNVGDKTVAQFLGTQEEQTKTKSEHETACRSRAGVASAPEPGLLDVIIQKIRIFFPSDLERPRDTMLMLEGDIAVKPTSTSSYEASFSYGISQYEGRREGKPEDVTYRMVLLGQAERITPLLVEQLKKTTFNLATDKVVNFRFSAERWILSSAYYEFRDRKNRIVARYDFPIFVPFTQR